MKEIGSEFWYEPTNCTPALDTYQKIGNDSMLVFSGRTAISIFIEEINAYNKTIYMSDYGCTSMMQPFIDSGCNIKLYNVIFNDNKIQYNIDESMECDVFFATSYFGYQCTNMDNFIQKFHDKGKIVVEDITHRLFQEQNHSPNADYLIASVRKWVPSLCGGLIVSMNQKLTIDKSKYKVDKKHTQTKTKAMQQKYDYIIGKSNNKSTFLNLYNEANKSYNDYLDKDIDSYSKQIIEKYDYKAMIQQRKKNAKIIYKYLTDIDKIQFLIQTMQEADCPLFVPVIFQNKEQRDKVKEMLIQKQIYCPVHWPKPLEEINSDIYDRELSLICDQRYSEEEIEKYIKKLIEIIEAI